MKVLVVAWARTAFFSSEIEFWRRLKRGLTCSKRWDIKKKKKNQEKARSFYHTFCIYGFGDLWSCLDVLLRNVRAPLYPCRGMCWGRCCTASCQGYCERNSCLWFLGDLIHWCLSFSISSLPSFLPSAIFCGCVSLSQRQWASNWRKQKLMVGLSLPPENTDCPQGPGAKLHSKQLLCLPICFRTSSPAALRPPILWLSKIAT